ncbi:MAG TPA: hypothetical protein VFH51_15615, partial [Myxococcota bacterium]|nr:hypothetical protein [Myxococcota bacterium]
RGLAGAEGAGMAIIPLFLRPESALFPEIQVTDPDGGEPDPRRVEAFLEHAQRTAARLAHDDAPRRGGLCGWLGRRGGPGVSAVDRQALRQGLDQLMRQAVRSEAFATALQDNPRYRALAAAVSCRFGVPRLHGDLRVAFHTFVDDGRGGRVPVGRSLYDDRDLPGW